MSRAIVAYIKFDRSHAPGNHAIAVTNLLGAGDAATILLAVNEIIEEAASIAVDWTTMSLAEAGHHVRSEMAQRHPDLEADALDAIKWKRGFDWR